jgi:hypothetical protein
MEALKLFYQQVDKKRRGLLQTRSPLKYVIQGEDLPL